MPAAGKIAEHIRMFAAGRSALCRCSEPAARCGCSPMVAERVVVTAIGSVGLASRPLHHCGGLPGGQVR